MIAASDDRLISLFEFAVGLEPDKRARFLEHACPDIAQRRALEAMLAADRKSTRSILEARHPAGALGGHDDGDTLSTAPPVEWFRNLQHGTHETAELVAPRPPRHRTSAAREPRGGAHIIGPGVYIQHYELIREIGRGGMGAVYKARDTKLGRRVAIKFLHTDDSKLTERFVLEARATARCSHENIIVIHDVGHFQAVPYMVLEYLEGEPLNKLVGDERMAPARAVQLLVPVARALACAHAAKIVHRDLKPANIFMTASGTIKVLDFGIAKFVREIPALDEHTRSLLMASSGAGKPSPPTTAEFSPELDLELTRRGSLLGTLPYMSPEQWGVDAVDHRTDVWAVGIMLYRMICGRHPLGALRGEQLMVTAVLDQPMPSAHAAGVDMPLGLADIIDSCLKKRKNERMPSAARLLQSLERYLPGHRPAEIDGEECPYSGLSAFQEADAARFFGREREIKSVIARLHATPLITLAGTSGAGKSSLVRAGVIPALRHTGESWEALTIRPGRHPIAALADLVVPMVTGDSSLSEQAEENQKARQRLYSEPGYLGTVLRARARSRDGKLLLFIDQFEELFTMSPDRTERQAFTACLAGLADDALSPLRLVISVRSDFLDRLAEDREFMGELVQGLLFIGPPDRNGLRDAIVKPAELMRYRFDNVAMVEHMLDTLQATPGCLPLLQFAASKLWDTRDQERRVLTKESYDALGGVLGALATHADAVLGALAPRDQRLVRTIFLHLVTPERTRAIKSIDELRELSGTGEDIDKLIQHLVNARLLIIQKGERQGKHAVGTVEIVHEAMIHSWPTLAHWLDENQDDAVFLEQIATAARQWDSRGRPRELLWRGEPLNEATTWRKRYKEKLPATQEDFLRAGFSQATRARRIKRLVVAGSMVFLALIAVAAMTALLMLRDKEAARVAAVNMQSLSRDQLIALNLELEDKATEAEQASEKFKQESEDKAHALHELEQSEKELKQALRRAEQATNDAISSRVQAEMALKGVEKAREEAEKAREEAEKTREEAESAREEAEKAKKEAEKAKKEAEKAKKEAEQASTKLDEQLKEERRIRKTLEGARRDGPTRVPGRTASDDELTE